MNWNRRDFFRASAIPAAGISVATATPSTLVAGMPCSGGSPAPAYAIGLSQVSLYQTIGSGKLDPLDYPQFAMDQFGIQRIDVCDRVMPAVNDRLPFLEKVRARSEQAGTDIFLLRVDSLRLVSDDPKDRIAEVNRFYQRVDQAAVVGARYLRIWLNVGSGSFGSQAVRAACGLKRLADYAATKQISIVVEPGIDLSRNGLWLARVMKDVDHPNCGSMPNFGKFGAYDQYAGTAALMASANVISAKSHAFDEEGLELQTDYPKQFQMMVDSGFDGIVLIEFEGKKSEVEGIKATQKLLQRLQETSAI